MHDVRITLLGMVGRRQPTLPMSVRYPPVQRGELKELVVEEFSRLGRNVGDVINTLDWLESHEVNVVVRNGLTPICS